MRKLTVKNFSVIKEAELEFGKITVLIGPQASGKSLLCKLAFFFGPEGPENCHGTLLLRYGLSTNVLRLFEKSSLNHFPEVAWAGTGFYYFLTHRTCIASLSKRGGFWIATLYLNSKRYFPEKYALWIQSHLEEVNCKAGDCVDQKRRSGCQTFRSSQRAPFYIPTGRVFLLNTQQRFCLCVWEES